MLERDAINDFLRIFRKERNEFQNYDIKEKMEVLDKIMKNDFLLKEAIEIIKEDENNNGNIFLNLLSLMPFSLKIIEEFLRSNAISDIDAYKKLSLIFKTNSQIIKILQHYKRNFRNQNLRGVLDSDLEEVERELDKYKGILERVKELEKKRAELLKMYELSNKEKNLKKEIEELKNSLKEYKKLKNEIENSKKIFKNLCKDES